MAVTPSTYNAQDDRAHDAIFLGKIRQAIVTAAIAIQNESPTVAYHGNRANFAYEVLRDPSTWAQIMANGVVSNPSVDDNSTDSTIFNIVSAIWDAYAVPGKF